MYSVRHKKHASLKFCAELCQFLGGDWKVIIAVQQHSQPLLTARFRGEGLFLSKKTPQQQ
jgi:hypothetical protein